MKVVFAILSFSIIALFISVKCNVITEKEKAIEDKIRNAFRDPINLGNFNVGPGNGVLRVNQTINNMIVSGLAKAEITKAKANLKQGTVFLSYKAKRLTAYVDYEVAGSCLFIPIWGKGKGVVVMDDVRVTANATVETLDSVIKITDMQLTFDISGGSFSMSSLFGETPPGILTSTYVKLFNANAKYIFNEILPPYIAPSAAKLTGVWGKLLENV